MEFIKIEELRGLEVNESALSISIGTDAISENVIHYDEGHSSSEDRRRRNCFPEQKF